MPYIIKLTPSAATDLQNAVDWEDERSIGLGEHCLNDIEERLIDISNVPAIGSIRYDAVRCVTSKVFQYLIHYRINNTEKQIEILRIWNVKQKPLWE